MLGTSRYDIELFAWGSRSTSSVRLPRSERAAARLMAVVVFPTPPFWLAIATIIWRWFVVAGRGSLCANMTKIATATQNDAESHNFSRGWRGSWRYGGGKRR